MKTESQIWIDALDPDEFKDDIDLIKEREDKCYHFLSQFVSLKSILTLDKYLKFQIATRDDPVLKEMRATIKDDVMIIRAMVSKNMAKNLLANAKIDGIKGYYYYLRLPEGWHRVITFRKIFSLYKLEYSRFHIGEDEEESPGFKTKKELIQYWKRGFFDKVGLEWKP